MNTRFNYVKPPKRDSSKDDELICYTYEKRMRVLSNQKDGSVDKYVEESFYKEEKNSWSEFVKSYDIGSVSKQVMDHLNKGTPLVTAHTLPPADYTKLEEGAKLKREMQEKGITLDDIVASVVSALDEKNKADESAKGE